MSLNAGVLSFVDGAIDAVDFALVVGDIYFNGGTPTDATGQLVVGSFQSGYLPQVAIGGLWYTDAMAILTDALGAITGHTGSGLPYTAVRGLATSFGQPVTSYAPAGIPLDANGRVVLPP